MIDVLVVGGGFGRDFLPLYQLHPETGAVGLVEPRAALRREVADAFGLDAEYETSRTRSQPDGGTQFT